MSGYREAPEDSARRRRDWLDLAIAVAAAFASMIGLSYFRDSLVTRGLPPFAFNFIRFAVALLVVRAVIQWLERGRERTSRAMTDAKHS